MRSWHEYGSGLMAFLCGCKYGMFVEVYEYKLRDYPNQMRDEDVQVKLSRMTPSACGVVTNLTD